MAIVFGSHPAIAAFMVAFRFATLIRRLFGEGPLSSGFIPHFEKLRAEAPEKGAVFIRDLFFSLSLILLFVILVIEVILWGILHWGHLNADNAQIVELTALMLPGVLFICLFSLSAAVLQCERKFFLTGFAPAAFNIVWIIATVTLKNFHPTQAVFYLSLAIIVAFLIQWLVLVPGSLRQISQYLPRKECFKPRLFSLELGKLTKPFLLGIIGVGAIQINSTLDAIFARYASLEGPAYLWYAIRIQQLPLALFGIALSAALLPPLARAIKEGSHELYLKLLRFALRRSLSLIVPCTLGIFVLGVSGINLLYGHGDFSSEAVYQTTLCLWGYGFGLLPSVFVLLLAPAFYASGEFKRPMWGSVLSVCLNTALTAGLVFGLELGAFSIAVATSICAWFNYFYLAHYLSKKLEMSLMDKPVWTSFWKVSFCSSLAALLTLLVAKYFIGDPTLEIVAGEKTITFMRDFKMQCVQFAALSGTFLLIIFSYARMCGADDILEFMGIKIRDGS